MKNYDKNKEPSYLKYWDVNNLYGWAMSQKLPVNDFKWIEETSQFNEGFIKIYNEDSNIEYFIETDVQYPGNSHNLSNDLSFLPEIMKIEKIEKLFANLHHKGEYVIHIRNLKQALNHKLVLKKSACSHKDFFKLMNNVDFGKAMGNLRKHRDIKLVTTEPRRNYLVSEPNYHKTNFFLAIEMNNNNNKKTQIFLNKSAYLGLSILEISKIVMYEFFHDYVKPKYGGRSKKCYMDADNFIVYIETEGIYLDCTKDVETRFYTSNYELDKPLRKGK